MKHLVFYDGTCGFCDAIVQQLLKVDKNEIFAFAPLQGETANVFLKELPAELKSVDSLILVEEYQSNKRIWVLGQGAFRILWLLGGGWASIGWIHFLPPMLYNWGYRMIAKIRHRLMGKNRVCQLPDQSQKKRFLP